MKILLGVDESAHSKAAIDLIKQMKWAPGTRVLVVSAARSPVQSYSEIYIGAGSALVEALEVERHTCEEVVSRAELELRSAGFVTEARVLDGDPREALVEVARTERPDLLVVGSHGRTGLTKLLMGSVASHVVTHAPCHVLVVKQVQAK